MTSQQRTSSQPPPSVSSSINSSKVLLSANFGQTQQLSNYSMLFQQQQKQQEETYALKFELRQAQSELDKAKAIHQQDSMQLKNRITDIIEQKEKSQQVNDMLIDSLRKAYLNQSSSKAYMLEFDYVCDMVRMYTNQQNRRSSFIEQNPNQSLEDASIEVVQIKSATCQTDGELWPQVNLTYTPKEQDLLDKLQQLEKMARDSKNAKEKSHGQKNELASKVLELQAQCDEVNEKMTLIEQEKSELQSLVEFMKNAGYNQEQNLTAEQSKKESEHRQLYETLQKKYHHKKKSAKDKKHAYKGEIANLKRQLADALQKAYKISDEYTKLQLVQEQSLHSTRSDQPPQTTINLAGMDLLKDNQNQNNYQIKTARVGGGLKPYYDQEGGFSQIQQQDRENIQSTAQAKLMKQIQPSQLNCHVSQFIERGDQQQFVQDDPSNLVSTGQLSARVAAHPTKEILKGCGPGQIRRKSQRSTKALSTSVQPQTQIFIHKRKGSRYSNEDEQKTQDSSSKNHLHQRNFSYEQVQQLQPFQERASNNANATIVDKPLKLQSHAKLFSKFVNIGKEQIHQKSIQQQQIDTSSQQISSNFQIPSQQAADTSQSMCLTGSIVHQQEQNSGSQADDEPVIVSNKARYSGTMIVKDNSQLEPVFFEGDTVPEATFIMEESYNLTDRHQNEHLPDNYDKKEPSQTQLTNQSSIVHVSPQKIQQQQAHMNESNDQLVRIEASPNKRVIEDISYRKKSTKMRRRDNSIKISPVKSHSSPAKGHSKHTSPNKHNRSPCCQGEDSITRQEAEQVLKIAQPLSALQLAPLPVPIAQLDISKVAVKKANKGSIATTTQTQGQKYTKHQRKSSKNNNNFINHQNRDQQQQLLVEEQNNINQQKQQLSESRSCSISHHNLSSSSIEGMIKFGMQGAKKSRQNTLHQHQKHRDTHNYRSPQTSHSFAQLDHRSKSRSPNGVERDQINSIIDEITQQLKEAEQLNQQRSSLGGVDSQLQTNEDDNTNHGGFGDDEDDEYVICPQSQRQRIYNNGQSRGDLFMSTQSVGPMTHQGKFHMTQSIGQMNKIDSKRRLQHQQQQQQSQYQTRDALIDSHHHKTLGGGSCSEQTGGGCTHYHNHYESSKAGNINGGGVSELLIQQCFDKIGQSLDQLANKDRIIQSMIKDKFSSGEKKSVLRKKLKNLKQTLHKCQNKDEDKELLHAQNANLTFENRQLQDKVEITQNLLSMYQLDSPLKSPMKLQENSTVRMSRTSSQYDLNTLRKMAAVSFQRRKSPAKFRKKDKEQQIQQQQYQSTDRSKFEIGNSQAFENSLRVAPLTDRRNNELAMSKTSLNKSQIMALQRQELLMSMVKAGNKQKSSSKKGASNYANNTKQSQQKHMLHNQQQSHSRENKKRMHETTQSYDRSQFMMLNTQKVGGNLTQRHGGLMKDEQDTRCESSDNNGNFQQTISMRQHHHHNGGKNQFHNTTAMAQALKNFNHDLNSSTHSQSYDLSQELAQKKPDRSRDGFLKASKHHIAYRQQQQVYGEQKKTNERSQKSSRYDEEADEAEDGFFTQEKSQEENINEDEMVEVCQVQIEDTPGSIGDYILPGQVMGGRSELEMNENNLGQMHERQQVCQAFNKMLVIQNQPGGLDDQMIQAQSYQSENDGSHVLYDNAAQFRGVKHPQKNIMRDQSPTIGEDSDITEPDDFFLANQSHLQQHQYQQQSQDEDESSSLKFETVKVAPQNHYYYQQNN